VTPRGLATVWLVLLAVGLAFGLATHAAFGWFGSAARAIVLALVWATGLTAWIWLRGRLFNRS
jgi:hypothetical protein